MILKSLTSHSLAVEFLLVALSGLTVPLVFRFAAAALSVSPSAASPIATRLLYLWDYFKITCALS